MITTVNWTWLFETTTDRADAIVDLMTVAPVVTLATRQLQAA